MILEARNLFKRADHMAYVTYPLVKETKLLLNILSNLNVALLRTMDSFLMYERYYKRTMRIPGTVREKLELLQHLGRNYGLTNEQVKLVKEVNSIIQAHKDSPIELTRKDKFVIFSNSYSEYKSVDINVVKSHLLKAKVFIARVHSILING